MSSPLPQTIKDALAGLAWHGIGSQTSDQYQATKARVETVEHLILEWIEDGLGL